MRGKRALILMLCCLFSIVLFSETVVINPQAREGVSFKVVDNSEKYTIIDVHINSYTKETIEINNEKYLQIGLPTVSGVTLEKGFPSLPIVARSIIIDSDSKMEIEVLEQDYTEFAGNIAPSKGNLYRNVNPDDIPYTFDDIYQKDAFYPADNARLTDPYVMRELRGIAVQILPIAVSPVQQTVRVYHHISLKIYANGKDHQTVLPNPPQRITDSFIDIYKDHFINYDYYDTRYTSITEQGSMLIICYTDFTTAMQPFIEWKNQKGIPTTMVTNTTAGSTGAAVKTYIANYYNSNPSTAFVLLVGDSGQIPYITYSGGGEIGPADPSYAFITGGSNDYYPDLLVGRFSAQTVADVTTQVDRTIHYERDLTTNATWVQNAIGIASNAGQGDGHDGGESDQTHIANIRTRLLDYGYNTVDAIYQANGSTASQVSTAINAGRSYINYAGHGNSTAWSSPYYSNSSVNALTNSNMLPFVISVACENGKFTGYSACFAEAWMRTSSGGSPRGAISTFMCSILQAWAPPMTTQDKIADLLIAGQKQTAGGLVYNAQSAMLDVNNNFTGREVMQTWILFGDPSLVIRTKTPQNFNVQASATLPLGTSTYTVNAGMANAQVCLIRTDTQQIVDSGFTGSSGQITLYIGSVSAVDTPLLLTITGFNKVTYTQEMQRSDAITDPIFIVSPPFHNFGGFYINQTSPTQTFTIQDVVNGPVTVNGITMIGTNASDFELTVSDLPWVGNTGNTTTFTVSFTPASAGAKDASISITSNAYGSPYIINLTGTGISTGLPLPYTQNFNEGTDLSAIDWVGDLTTYSGIKSGSGVGNTNGLSLNVYNITTSQYAYTPRIATIATTTTLSFAYRIVNYTSNWSQVSSFTLAGNNKVLIEVSASGSTDSYTTLHEVNSTNHTVATTFATLTLPLSAYNGENINIRFMASWASGDWCFVLDDVVVSSPPAVLNPPTDLVATAGSSLVALNWLAPVTHEHSATLVGYKIYRGDAILPDGIITEPTTLTFTDTNVVSSTTYTYYVTACYTDPVGESVQSNIVTVQPLTESNEVVTPIVTGLAGNYPNPFNPDTVIQFTLAQQGKVSIDIYSINGQLVRSLVSGVYGAGLHSAIWNGHDNYGRTVGSGVYFYRMSSEDYVSVRKMVLVK